MILREVERIAREKGCFCKSIPYVNHPDGTPRYENTAPYAILKKKRDKE